MRLLTVIPAATQSYCDEHAHELRPFLLPSTEHVVTYVDNTLPDLEYYYYGALATPTMIAKMKRAEEAGFDAVIVGCFYDTGLREAREVLTIPVVGPGEVSFHHAAMVAESIGVIVGRRKMLPKLLENARTYGVWHKIVAWESAELTVQELRYRTDEIYARLRDTCARAMERGAEALVLACGSMGFYSRRLSAELGCAVLDPRILSTKYAEMEAQLYRSTGLSHSKRWGYESPDILRLDGVPEGAPALSGPGA